MKKICTGRDIELDAEKTLIGNIRSGKYATPVTDPVCPGYPNSTLKIISSRTLLAILFAVRWS
jgi:hypothetical protein